MERVNAKMEMKSAVIPRGTESAKVISVIETRAMKGAGINNDPVRQLIQYWDFEGNLLAEFDSWNNNQPATIMARIESEKYDLCCPHPHATPV